MRKLLTFLLICAFAISTSFAANLYVGGQVFNASTTQPVIGVDLGTFDLALGYKSIGKGNFGGTSPETETTLYLGGSAYIFNAGKLKSGPSIIILNTSNAKGADKADYTAYALAYTLKGNLTDNIFLKGDAILYRDMSGKDASDNDLKDLGSFGTDFIVTLGYSF